MTDIKGMLQSKTIWGALIAGAAIVLNMFHINLGDASGFADDIVGLIGAVLAIYGRITAVKKIGS